ncbi:hypothetical protein BHYA_0086g00210 [Botrytis hyacinthi]|uniref:Uncharacterized protein n=1 Tax=Botrytis hyacinthi TaxID=278943 RepID=A0A4Z1GM10_9HELO|nr:hypothetical protein BHYA_0086g00210 [Botrytis hyacinthi]
MDLQEAWRRKHELYADKAWNVTQASDAVSTTRLETSATSAAEDFRSPPLPEFFSVEPVSSSEHTAWIPQAKVINNRNRSRTYTGALLSNIDGWQMAAVGISNMNSDHRYGPES